jgi:hypothetical protein
MKVEFLDSGREPQVNFDRRWPWGKDIDSTQGQPSCMVMLPWPAPRCGVYVIECETCGYRLAATVAGRVDDPRSVKLPCKVAKH